MTRLETAQALREHDNFIILTHRRPDGDTSEARRGCAWVCARSESRLGCSKTGS